MSAEKASTVSPVSPEGVEELRRLGGGYSSPAPWKISFHGMVDPGKPWRLEDTSGDTVGWFISGADAALVLAVRNALPALLDELEAARKEAAAWKTLEESARDGRHDTEECWDVTNALKVERDAEAAWADLLSAALSEMVKHCGRCAGEGGRRRYSQTPGKWSESTWEPCSVCAGARGLLEGRTPEAGAPPRGE